MVQVDRGQNRQADSLATLASSSTKKIPQLIKVKLVAESSINVGVGVSLVTTVEPCWMDPIINFLAEDRVPVDEKKQKKYVRQLLSIGYQLIVSYTKGLYLQCLYPSKIEELLTELHEGVCGSHVGGRSLAY